MSHKKNRSLKFVQGLGYGVLTGVSAVGVVVFATATVGFSVTIIGVPVAILCLAATGGCVAGTVYFGYKTGDKFVHAFESEDLQPNYVTNADIKHVSEHFSQDQIQENRPQLMNQADITGSSKPFFAPASRQSASNAPVMDTVTSSVFEDDAMAKAGM